MSLTSNWHNFKTRSNIGQYERCGAFQVYQHTYGADTPHCNRTPSGTILAGVHAIAKQCKPKTLGREFANT